MEKSKKIIQSNRMAMRQLEIEIIKILNNRKAENIEDNGLIPSAVLIPLFQEWNDYSIIFTKRQRTMKRPAGQISFPGGIYENYDKDIKRTAIRETCEELGLAQNNIEILGRLDDLTIRTGYLVTPFVGVINSPHNMKVNRSEIEEIITIPISDLMNISPRIDEREATYPIYYYDYQNHVIWGATARILKDFLGLVRNELVKRNQSKENCI